MFFVFIFFKKQLKVTEDYSQQTSTIGSRDAEEHCGNNGNSSSNNNHRKTIVPPLLAIYEMRGGLRLSFLEILPAGFSQRTHLKLASHKFILPEEARGALSGYDKISYDLKPCSGKCPEKGYCDGLVFAIAEAELLGTRMANLVTLQCPKMLSNTMPTNGNCNFTVTYYREKQKSS